MIKTDGIIFDMDGTIWDNTEIFAKSWNKVARSMGYDTEFTADILRSEFGKKMEDIADAIIPDPIPERRYKALYTCEEVEMADLMASSEDTTYDGLEETLRELSEVKNIPLYIVSNCQSGYIEGYFEKHGHEKYFKGFLCYGDNGHGKAENLRILCEKYGIKAPVYIGDIQGDKDSCDEAEVPFIWAAYGYGASVNAYAEKIDDIKELPECVELY